MNNKIANGVFITGTDTGVGKTYFTLACIKALQQAGIKTAAMKPIASGAELVNGQLCNEDGLHIQQALNIDLEYKRINPYVFATPVSPHIAAAEAGVEIDLQKIRHAYQDLSRETEFVIVEAVGGWLAPLSARQGVADLARVLDLPVIMVVAIRLGCLNHAMLTAQAILQSGLTLKAWVANLVEPKTRHVDEQIKYLSNKLQQAPMLVMEHQEEIPVNSEIVKHLL